MGQLYKFELAGRTYGLMIAHRRFYVLEDGRLLPIRVRPAWCEGCRRFRASEQIFPTAEEAKELSEFEYFAERPGLIPPDRRLPLWQLPELRVRKSWRERRQSPAKCLDCGSVAITPVLPGPDVHIPGHGKCVTRLQGLGDMSSGPTEYYSPEGDRVPFKPARRRSGF